MRMCTCLWRKQIRLATIAEATDIVARSFGRTLYFLKKISFRGLQQHAGRAIASTSYGLTSSVHRLLGSSLLYAISNVWSPAEERSRKCQSCNR